MRLTHFYSLFLSLFVVSSFSAQTISPEVVASSGNTLISGDVVLDFTIGEVVIDTYTGTVILTQGFQQSRIIITHVPNEEYEVEFNIYPNPTSDYVMIDFHSPVSSILELYDIQGKLILNHSLYNQESFQLNLQTVASGSYLLKVNIADRVSTYQIQITK